MRKSWPIERRQKYLPSLVKYCKENKDRLRKKGKSVLKKEMVTAYGGKCSCCGETELTFLTLEHIHRNGKEHRQIVGRGGVWIDLRRKGWPQDGYTVFCWNCQMATRYGAPCPHQLKKAEAA
jgi:hypothetical protein